MNKFAYSIVLLLLCMGLISCSTPKKEEVISQPNAISLSSIAENLGMRVLWVPSQKKAVLEQGECHVSIEPNSNIAWVQGEAVAMEFPAYLNTREIYVPISFYNKLKTVLQDKPDVLVAPSEKVWDSTAWTIPQKPIINFTVILDAGHGGRDPGAISQDQTQQEKNLTLDIVFRLRELLQKYGITVILTRDRDAYISLDERIQKAESVSAHCLVSVHLNSVATATAQGFEIWISRNTQEPRYLQSYKLGQYIHYSMKKGLPLRDRRIRKSGFQIIHRTKIPSVLIETCFISNPQDFLWIMDPMSRQAVAQAISQGILAYYFYEVAPK